MTKPERTEPAPASGHVGNCLDVAVVGGGLAGLGAALTLGRARRAVVASTRATRATHRPLTRTAA